MSLGGIGARRFIKLFFSLCGLGLLVSGCSSIPGYPKPIQAEIDGAQNTLLTCNDEGCRNQKVFELIAASDRAFEIYKRKLYKEGVSFDLATDISRWGLEAAAAVTGGPGMKSALSATAGGLGAVQASVDKRVYFEQTLTAIIQLMIAKRNEVLLNIYGGLQKSFEEYPLGAALHDIRLYHSSGSIPEALAEVVKEAKEKANKAEEKVADAARNLEFVSKKSQDEVEKLLAQVDSLPNERAWDILQNLPSDLDDYTSKAIEARLGNIQLSAAGSKLGGTANDSNAKAILKMILVLINDRSVENLAKWEAAIISEQ